jgi:hypothetical protein
MPAGLIALSNRPSRFGKKPKSWRPQFIPLNSEGRLIIFKRGAFAVQFSFGEKRENSVWQN